jgi:hypothetical protein
MLWVIGQIIVALVGMAALTLGVVTIWYVVGFVRARRREPSIAPNGTLDAKEGGPMTKTGKLLLFWAVLVTTAVIFYFSMVRFL